MRDPFGLEPVHRLQQILAETRQQLHVQSALGAEPLRQCLVASEVKDEDLPAGNLQLAMEFDDVLMAKLAEDIGFCLEAIVLLRRQRHLQHQLAALMRHQQGHRRGALAQTVDDLVAAGQLVTRACFGGLDGRLDLLGQ